MTFYEFVSGLKGERSKRAVLRVCSARQLDEYLTEAVGRAMGQPHVATDVRPQDRRHLTEARMEVNALRKKNGALVEALAEAMSFTDHLPRCQAHHWCDEAPTGDCKHDVSCDCGLEKAVDAAAKAQVL